MAFPSFFLIFLIVVFLVQHHLRKSRRLENQKKLNTGKKEEKSLSVRRKEFTDDDFIQPDINKLHFDNTYRIKETDLPLLRQITKDIKRLSQLDMMNFSHMTNSEIRIAFGTANQTVVQANEEHYDLYLKAVAKYGYIMLDNQEIQEATCAFEHCVDLGSEYHDHYLTLAGIYKDTHKKEAIQQLIEKASILSTINSQILVNKINNYLS